MSLIEDVYYSVDARHPTPERMGVAPDLQYEVVFVL